MIFFKYANRMHSYIISLLNLLLNVRWVHSVCYSPRMLVVKYVRKQYQRALNQNSLLRLYNLQWPVKKHFVHMHLLDREKVTLMTNHWRAAGRERERVNVACFHQINYYFIIDFSRFISFRWLFHWTNESQNSFWEKNREVIEESSSSGHQFRYSTKIEFRIIDK